MLLKARSHMPIAYIVVTSLNFSHCLSGYWHTLERHGWCLVLDLTHMATHEVLYLSMGFIKLSGTVQVLLWKVIFPVSLGILSFGGVNSVLLGSETLQELASWSLILPTDLHRIQPRRTDTCSSTCHLTWAASCWVRVTASLASRTLWTDQPIVGLGIILRGLGLVVDKLPGLRRKVRGDNLPSIEIDGL